MPTNELVKRLHDLAGFDADSSQNGDWPGAPNHVETADTLIGFFQNFRPDGSGLDGAFDQIAAGDQLQHRLELLFDVAGNDVRPEGGRDAYFVVRKPKPLDPVVAESLANEWLNRISELASTLGDVETVSALQPLPTIRVLEGIPPKHPKRDEEKSELLKAFQNDIAMLTARIDAADPHAAVLRKAYYFIACDTMLRDYLMWPLYAAAAAVEDPFQPYFQLWCSGVKYRIFGETQIDLYLPRAM